MIASVMESQISLSVASVSSVAILSSLVGSLSVYSSLALSTTFLNVALGELLLSAKTVSLVGNMQGMSETQQSMARSFLYVNAMVRSVRARSTRILSTTSITVSLHTQELHTQELEFVLLTDVVEFYEILDSRFALEHRYHPKWSEDWTWYDASYGIDPSTESSSTLQQRRRLNR